ncbi:MAG: biopolymer transporter ExbD [Muricauda sp.]|nr:biopolymer transporter ExbD [Allomuricauda sp.]MBC32279.1 biopolymer transporter ExbD [Allomuricauda sp.]|tara:strand:+ start:55814 stop:56446 length:633 start_codon:yes stop_codon:yes gene_type:complete
MAKDRQVPEVNAGSMADIAFLLLIFFLVTTSIETNVGIQRKLPPDLNTPPPHIKERNILRVRLNKNNQLMVGKNVFPISELKKTVISFLDNGGAPLESEGHCAYCQGSRNPDSSDNPLKAVISLQSDREAEYGVYVSVQNELTAAYNQLRNRESLRLYGVAYTEMEEKYNSPETAVSLKKKLKPKIMEIRKMYPLKISEASLKLNESNQP